MNMKRILLSIVSLVLVFSNVVVADTVNVSNITILERVYYTESYAVPLELFLSFILLGFLFLIVGLISDEAIIPFSIISFMCFLVSAYSSPMVGFFNYETVTINETFSIIPYVNFIGQPWMMFLLYGFALIAFLNIWRGVLYSLQRIRLRKMENM